MARISNKEYFLGEYGVKYGIWNSKRQQFQFGIAEDTPMLAEAKLFNEIGNDARQWRFKVRKLSEGELKKMQEKKADFMENKIRFLEELVDYAVAMIPEESCPEGVPKGRLIPWMKNRVHEKIAAEEGEA